MKTTRLLPAAVMLMFTALTAIAQESTDKKFSVQDIPFGKKLPPPDAAEYFGKSLPRVIRPNIHSPLIPGKNSRDINAIRKSVDDYRQQLMKLNLQIPKSNMNAGRGNANTDIAGFHLTKDINALTESNPSNANLTGFYVNTPYPMLDGVIYFAADDGIHGNELWRSDGTAPGTFMVMDIEPGAVSSYPREIASVNGKIYFSATTINYGTEPWISDGTESGTQLLMDIKPGDISSFAMEFTSVGNDIYFVTNGDFSEWGALWKTGGTTESTKLVKSIGDIDAGGFYITQLLAVDKLLFFTFLSFSTGGWELWRSDGTDEGTYHVATNALFYDPPFQLTNYNNKLYFTSNDYSGIPTGNKLWVSDGTDAGTTPAAGSDDIQIIPDYLLGTSFSLLDNALYMCGYSLTGNSGLYKYDASNSQGLVLVKDLTSPDSAVVYYAETEVVNSTLYFKLTRFYDNYYDELWNSNGTTVSTQRIHKFLPDETINYLSNGSGNLYFVKKDKFFGSELWRVANTRFGTFPLLVKDIFRGATGSYPDNLTAFKGKLFFGTTDEVKGRELFMTDGFGASLVKDINTVGSANSLAGYYINTITPVGDNAVFMAFDKAHGEELYTSDGTEQGTLLLKDIAPGEASSAPFDILSKNNAAYFIARDRNFLYSIYKTNGTKNSVQKVVPDYNYLQEFKVADNGVIFYMIWSYTTFVYELWRSNGTASGTFLLSSTVSSNPYLNVAGNTAFFVAGDSEHGYELWKSDGSTAGTMLVKDINPGAGNSTPGGMFAYNNEVYFAAYNGANPSFWKSDGTEAGTIQLQNIDPWYESDVFGTERYFFCVSNNILYFSAVDVSDTKGTQVWKTDGTVAGTQVVKDTDPDATGYYPVPFYFRDVNGTVFFIEDVSGGVPGTKLWKTDGTEAGTQIVKDIAGETDPVFLNNMTSFAGKLFFTNNGVLWSSDGTADGTTQVDAAGLSDVYIHNIVVANDQLFLSGQTYKYGIELYACTINETGKFVASKTSNVMAAKTTVDFNAVLYPNPVVSNAALQITGNAKNVSVSITDMSGKKLWQVHSINAMLIKLPVEKYTPGIYIITITNGKETKTIMLAKQ